MNRQNSIKRDRSFESVLNKFLSATNHESFKTALYNFLIAAGVLAFAAVCIILGPFVRPLIWAFLIGAVLFPFKRKLATLLNTWFCDLEDRDLNVFIAIATTPIQVAESSGRILVNWIKTYWKILIASLSIVTVIKLLMLYAPKNLFCGILRILMFGHTIFTTLTSFLNIYQIVLVIILYITAVKFLWRTENSKHFIIAGQSLWVILIAYVCSFLGALQVPVFVITITTIIAAVIYNIQKTEQNNTNIQNGLLKLLDKKYFHQAIDTVYENSKNDENSCSEDIKLIVEDLATTKTMSDFYLKYLFYACIATFLYRNILLCLLAIIPIAVHIFYTMGNVFGISNSVFTKIYDQFKKWCLDHHSAVLPLWFPGLLELNYLIQKYIRNTLKSSIDLFTSILMIILMILISIFVSVFFCVNIYSETIEVAYLGKDLINKTITDRPELINILPANIQDSIDDALDNAHHYGRRRIEQYIDEMLKDADEEHGTKLKNQILDVWDRLIQYWIDFNKTDTFGPRIPTEALRSTFDNIVDNPDHFKELVLVAKQGIIGWAKSNTNTILEVTESLWHIIRTNISLILGVAGEIFSLLLSGGQACIEFILDMIVFFTALFYLLSISHIKYAPMQFGEYFGVSSGSKIAETLENSISGVLIAMFKCAIFQGMFAWFIHTVIGARIIFLPSALAAILSAAPFLGSYWCALPAFLELWLAQDRLYAGVILILLMFFVPPYFEAEVYAEMKGGGHPYLTGLAIAGGMYWLGWQGAIFGPLMISFFIGIFEVAAVTLRPNESNEKSSPLEGEEKISKEENKLIVSAENPNLQSSVTESGGTGLPHACILLVNKTISTTLPHNPTPWSSVTRPNV